MKIVLTPLQHRYLGLSSSLQCITTVEFWNPKKISLYDLLYENSPDLILCGVEYITKSFIEAWNIHKPNLVLFGKVVPPEIAPVLICCEPKIKPALKKNLEDRDCPVLYLQDCADICNIWGGTQSENYTCDVGYISKTPPTDSMIEVLFSIEKSYRLKIVGPQPVPLPNYLGNIKEGNISSFMKSCNILLDFDGSQLLDGAANRAYVLSLIPNKLFESVTPEDITDKISRLQNDTKTVSSSYNQIMSTNTCYHQLTQVLNALNITEYRDTINNELQRKMDEGRNNS